MCGCSDGQLLFIYYLKDGNEMKAVIKDAMRKLVTAIVLMSMIATCITPAVFAEGETADKWDGESVSEPAKQGGAYQITKASELAWFRDRVNSGAGASDNAVLAGDIDLGDHKWEPIGKSSSYKYSGTFDGNGHKVAGIYVEPGSNEQAGFFGYISAATIKGLRVEGKVKASNSAAGGLVSRSAGSSKISECGSEIDVENTQSSGKSAGIIGWAEDDAAITSCYNRGSVTSGDRASGIIADTGMAVTVTDCYNTGAITGNKANGIGSATGITYTNCYSAGKLTGSTSSYGIGASNYADYINTYILQGTASKSVNTDPAPVEMTAGEMKKASFAETLGASWKTDVGGAVNGGFPLLLWEEAAEVVQEQLAAPSGLEWEEQRSDDPDNFDITYGSFIVKWNGVENANGYIVKLYEKNGSEPVFVSEETEKTEYDLSEYFGGEGKSKSAEYRFTVTAKGDDAAYTDSEESEPDGKGFVYDSAAHIDAPAKLSWNEASKIAVFEAVKGADFYIVTLYRGEKEVVETKLDRKVIGDNTGNISAYFLNNITGSGKYYFTVRAGKTIDDEASPNNGKTCGSVIAKSDVMDGSETQGDAITIDSAEQWMEIVNLEAAGTEYMTDADRQKVEWSKNYVLGDDLDFSGLNTEQQSRTKSWGNIDAPFNGTLDGQGHKITGLTLSDGDAGLFNYIGKSGTVKNVTVVDANLLVSDNAAVFAHYNYGKIQNCHVRNTNITTDYAGVIGPMASRNFGTIESCTVQGGKLIARTSTSNGHSGFVGNNTGTVKRCWTSMDVRTESYNAGGFAGWSDEQYQISEDGETVEKVYGTFEDCFALGNVHAAKGWSGGFIGRINSAGNLFTNCYAAGAVTSDERPERCYGFVGSYGSEGLADINGTTPAFVIDPPEENFTNCFYDKDATAGDNPKNRTVGMASDDMKTDDFRSVLGLAWAREKGRNSGLPYLEGIPVPEKAVSSMMTVSIAVALYDKEQYDFVRDGETLNVRLATTGNTCVTDVMDEAVKQGLLTYEYKITPAYGSFIESINGHALAAPDGWMFTVNDELSNVSASISKVEDGDQVLWYQGTTQNLFAPPLWESITGEKPKIEWHDIETADDLIALTDDDADLTLNYRLTKDIDMAGVEFAGIGKYGHEFSGTFDGKGHTVKNVTINRPDDHNIGFFNFIRGASIKDLTLENVDITGRYSVGGMIGVADAEVNVQDRTKSIGNNIGNSSVTGKVTSVNTDQSATSDGSYTGGFIGFNDGETNDKTRISVYSSIDKCSADVKVKAGSFYTGGFVGGNYGYITDSSAHGEVEATRFTGGFAGGNEGGIYGSGAAGNVNGREYTAGFVGTSNGTIERCYSLGSVSGTGERVGGFVGAGSSSIKQCASAGTVEASTSCEYMGGFAGHYEGTYAGMEYQITFQDNYGWCRTESGLLKAIGNRKSSTSDAEQAVLDSTEVTEWVDMQDAFSRLFGLVLTDDGKVIVPKRDVDLAALAETLYETLDSKGEIYDQSPWIFADIKAYEKLTGKSGRPDDARKQEYADHIAAEVQKRDGGRLTVSAGDLAKYIISMKALGMDPRDLRYKGGNKEDAVDLVKMLQEKISGDAFKNEGLFVQPYVLIALSQDEGYATDDEINRMIDVLLSEELPQGGFGSADAAGPVVMALAMHMDREGVPEAIERTLDAERVTASMDDNGAVTYNGEATVESTAQMITALAAAGKDIYSYTKKDATLTDGLTIFVNEEETGFYHNYGRTGNPVIASEQGFRGLIALTAAKSDSRIIYDFRSTEVTPVTANVERDKSSEEDMPGPDEDDPEQKEQQRIKELEEKKEKSVREIAQIIKKNGSNMDYGKAVSEALDVIRDVTAAKTSEEVDQIMTGFRKTIDLLVLRQFKTVRVSGVKVRKGPGKKALTVKWNKVNGATGYKVEYSLKKSMKGAKIRNVKGASRVRLKLKKLKKGKRYYVRVTAFRNMNGKRYSGRAGKVIRSKKVK